MIKNIENMGIDLGIDFSVIHNATQKISRDFALSMDNVIKDALAKHGFNYTNLDFIKDNFQFVIKDGDNFKHLVYKFGTKDEIRIISFEMYPKFNPLVINEEAKISIKLETKYY